MSNIKRIREAILEVIPQESATYGTGSKPQYIYIPLGHEKSLQLYSTLIVGARGVGKSFWAAVLENPDLRKIIQLKIPELEKTEVYKGFGNYENPGPSELTGTIIKDLISKGLAPHYIWQAVIARRLVHRTARQILMKTWEETVVWVKNNQEAWIGIVQEANRNLQDMNRNGLILFDALDRTSDNWIDMDKIVRELLRMVLQLKEYSNIYVKVFLRDDQYRRKVTDFADASKLMATQTQLTWKLHDLHGLLWQLFCNAPDEHGEILRSIYKDVVGKAPDLHNDIWILDDKIKREGANQRVLFERLAGPWMGKDPRRGVPYIWSVSHLADGNQLTSPRSFLTSIRAAIEYSMDKDGEYPLHYDGIKQGVQKASVIRISELTNEDYPWVNELIRPLQGCIVPIAFELIKNTWQTAYPDGYKPNGLQPEHLDEGWQGILKDLIQLGIFEKMYDGRINMPDLYRIGFKLGRKGGVKPVK